MKISVLKFEELLDFERITWAVMNVYNKILAGIIEPGAVISFVKVKEENVKFRLTLNSMQNLMEVSRLEEIDLEILKDYIFWRILQINEFVPENLNKYQLFVINDDSIKIVPQ